jgi:hypothetical protein
LILPNKKRTFWVAQEAMLMITPPGGKKNYRTFHLKLRTIESPEIGIDRQRFLNAEVGVFGHRIVLANEHK